MTDFKRIVRDAMARAKERAAPPSPREPPPSPHDAMQRQLIEQWAQSIGPTLVELKNELAGNELALDFIGPSESSHGHIDLEIETSEKQWRPNVSFRATDDGKAIEVTLTAGDITLNAPFHERVHVRQLTAERIAEYVARLIDQAEVRL